VLDLQQHAHRRFNPLTGQWVLVSPHRTARPWQGQVEPPAHAASPRHDPSCYMCPGNVRASGHRNPDYPSTFAFDNDFPAIVPGSLDATYTKGPLFVAEPSSGVCRVVCFSPRHDLAFSRLAAADVAAVVECWVAELMALRRTPGIAYIQIFENRGAMMGASNPHPHGQIWATSFVPDAVDAERTAQRRHADAYGTDLLGDYVIEEERARERLVAGNQHFACMVPFWATWPFETLLVPRRRCGSLEELDGAERQALGDALHRLTRLYDRLFNAPFPYSMGFHVRPSAGDGSFRFHAHFYPPLLRSATIRKFMVGFELLGNAQRDLTPERAAECLRQASV
jgi:UDPglucose--hexose-1-phosphate uridylyltransferase